MDVKTYHESKEPFSNRVDSAQNKKIVPVVPGLISQPMPSSQLPLGSTSKSKTTLFMDLSTRTKTLGGSARVQRDEFTPRSEPESVTTRGSWVSDANSNLNGHSALRNKNTNEDDDSYDDNDELTSDNKSHFKSFAGSPMRSSEIELGPYEPDEKIAEVLSDKDGEWVPLRESPDYNLQMENCYDGLNALQTRCG